MELIKILLNLFFSLITNPYFIVLSLLCVLMDIMYPKFRGFMGEFWVKQELKKLPKDKYIVLNDIMLKQNNSTHQIDHLIISKFGIFVIEMKNYYGLITGDDYKDRWIQHLGKKKNSFMNPIFQNYGHVKALEELLDLDNKLFIPIVCFSNQAKLKIKTKNSVVQLNYLVSSIKKHQNVILESNLDDLYNKIVELNIVDKIERKNHVKSIRTKIKNVNEKVDNMICPKCGSNLIMKNGKYGSFIGCSNYPKCRFTKTG